MINKNSDPSSRITPEFRVTTYYFVQAMSVGVVNAFAGIWFASRGISPEQIGVIFAAPLVLILLIGVSVGRIADRALDWREVIVAGALASAVAPLGLFFANGFYGILMVWTMVVTTQMMILPVTDAAAMRLSRRRNIDFSIFYAWKTIGYLLVIFSSGFVLTHFGTQAFLPLFIGLSLLRGFAALGLPNFRAPKTKTQKTKPTMSFFASIGPGFVLPLVGWSLVHCTHFILNGFLGVLWHQQGLSASTIGILIGVSSIAETIMFFTFKHLALRFSPQSLILLSCLVAVARWTLFAFSPGVEILFFCQLLHAVTYAAGFLACTNFIADQVSEEIAAEAQSFFSILQSALAILALGCFGWFAGTYGAKAFLVSAALAALGAFLILPGFFSQKRSGKLKADPHVE